MSKQNLTKIVIAVILTLAMFSSGIVGEVIGVPNGRSASACIGSGGGGGGGC